MSIRYKIMLILLILVLSTHVMFMTIYYNYSLNTIKQEAVKHLETMADIQKERLNTFINSNFEKLTLINSRVQLKNLLNKYNTFHDDNNKILIKNTLSSIIKNSKNIEDIFIINPDKKNIIAISNNNFSYLKDNFSMFFQNINKPVIHFLVDKKNIKSIKILFSSPIELNNKLLGIIVMQVEMDSLNEYLRDYTGLGMSGEVLMAVNYNENEMLFFTPLRFAKSPILVKKGSKTAKPMILALQKIETIIDNALDYRDKPVIAVTRYLSSLSFGIVVKMDKSELLNASNNFKIVFLELFILLISLVIFASIYISSMITNPIINIIETATIISQGNYKQKIPVLSKDELGKLSAALNKMAESLINSNKILEQKVKERTEELHKTNKQLEILSETDSLTGIANRGKFDKHIQNSFRRNKRYRKPLSLLIIDIDHFKNVNDQYGHQTGDDYLIKIVEVFKNVINRADDLCARYGGEEFALVLDDTNIEGATSIAEKIRKNILDLKLVNCNSTVCEYLTVSIGVVSAIPNDNTDVYLFIKKADEFLYQAKKNGRNTIVCNTLQEEKIFPKTISLN